MKIRTDHVTNSSSSSYVVVKHKDLTTEEIKRVINDNIGALKMILKDYNCYSGKDKLSLKDAKDIIISEIVHLGNPSINIGDWDIYVDECSNESYDIFSMFMYETSNFGSEYFKKGN